MRAAAEMASKASLRAAKSRAAYQRGEVRAADLSLAGCDWLVPTARGLFGASNAGAKHLLYGWFFGICRHDDRLYVFENCSHRDRSIDLGRVVRFDIVGDRLEAPTVLVTDLHCNCHQLAIFDDMLHVVDTNNQAIRRYTLDGALIDVRRPFQVAPVSDTGGAYLHINSVAKVGERIGLVLHNGVALPKKQSELAWLDADWNVLERLPLDGHMCHDLVEDDAGRLWYSSSEAGAVVRSDGVRLQITDSLLTRGIAFSKDRMAVGTCAFGPRETRGDVRGTIVLLDRALSVVGRIEVPSGPTDIIAVR